MSIAGFFSHGFEFELPHPPVSGSIFQIVHKAICHAFVMLRTNPPAGFSLNTAHENSITSQIEWILEWLRTKGQVPGFDERVFRKVRRAPEVTNFNGQNPSKKPDLVFDLARDEPLVLPTVDALFIECKVVDQSHHFVRDYCRDGTIRFINGDYAWAMQEGMMLAYVRNGYSLNATLVPAFAGEPLHTELGRPSLLAEVEGGETHPAAELLQLTTHNRSFAWPDNRGQAVPIRLFHSWHNCS